MLGFFIRGLLCGALGMAASGFADPYGTTHRDTSNVRLEVAVASALPTFPLTGAGVPVSGTNVTVAAIRRRFGAFPSTASAPWTSTPLTNTASLRLA